MRILVKPSDLVKRCIWDYYVYYILGSEKEAQRLLELDEEFEISERDALISGLLKVVETDNLIHRFNDYMVHFLTTKSVKERDVLFIKKKNLDMYINKFLDKFPDYWQAPINYLNALSDLVSYINTLRADIEELDLHKVVVQNTTHEVYASNSVKKLLSFNYY
jgi:hypothetical protein